MKLVERLFGFNLAYRCFASFPAHPRNGIVYKKKKKWERGRNRICVDLEDLLCTGNSAVLDAGGTSMDRTKTGLFKSRHEGDKLKI